MRRRLAIAVSVLLMLLCVTPAAAYAGETPEAPVYAVFNAFDVNIPAVRYTDGATYLHLQQVCKYLDTLGFPATMREDSVVDNRYLTPYDLGEYDHVKFLQSTDKENEQQNGHTLYELDKGPNNSTYATM